MPISIGGGKSSGGGDNSAEQKLDNKADSDASNKAWTEQNAGQTQDASSSDCKYGCGGSGQSQKLDQDADTKQKAESKAKAEQDAVNANVPISIGGGRDEYGKKDDHGKKDDEQRSSPRRTSTAYKGGDNSAEQKLDNKADSDASNKAWTEQNAGQTQDASVGLQVRLWRLRPVTKARPGRRHQAEGRVEGQGQATRGQRQRADQREEGQEGQGRPEGPSGVDAERALTLGRWRRPAAERPAGGRRSAVADASLGGGAGRAVCDQRPRRPCWRRVPDPAAPAGAAEATPPAQPAAPAPPVPAPVGPAPSEPAPAEPAPSEPVPAEPAPSEPPPAEPAPAEPAPSRPSRPPVPDATPAPLPPAGNAGAVAEPPARDAEAPRLDEPGSQTPVSQGTLAGGQNRSTVIQVVWQVQQGCRTHCQGTSQSQSVAQWSSTSQTATGVSGRDQTGASGSDHSAAYALNESLTIQFAWQTQIGCVAFCYETSQEQTASQWADTTQTAAAEAALEAWAENLSETLQFVWQLQEGCAYECYGVYQSQSSGQGQSTNQSAEATVRSGSDGTQLALGPDGVIVLPGWLVALANNVGATIQTIYQYQEASCLEHLRRRAHSSRRPCSERS